ncbi:MAG: hypothetical protein OK438_01995 [Thaumarchaeota archaeon]|nr:hypothetical protein [Nitrososphaerota archaeon]
MIHVWEVAVGIVFAAVWLPILFFSIAHWSTLPVATILSVITLVVFALFMGLMHDSS